MSARNESQTDTMSLIGQCIDGNRSAQKQLYETYAPFVKGIVFRYLSDPETCRDLLSEIFCKVFLKLELYKPTGPFKGWVRTMSVNTIIDYIRKNKKDIYTELTDFSDYSPYVSESAISNLNYKELLKIIATLPDTQRAVFNLFVIEQLTHDEISTLLNISVNNSRWHLNRARKSLKEIILRIQ